MGSYNCACPEGFELVGSRNCKGETATMSIILVFLKIFYLNFKDINECDGDVCNGENDFCLNTYGSFKCFDRSCKQGYRYRDTDGFVP